MNNRTPEEAIQTIRKNWPDERYTMLREALEYAITAIEENAKLVKALEWYASFWNHNVQLEDVGVTSMQRDKGQRARDVLSELRGGNPNEPTGSSQG